MSGNSSRNNNGKSAAKVTQLKPVVFKVLEALKSQKKASDQNMLDYEGEAAGVTKRRNNLQATRERNETLILNKGSNKNKNVSNIIINRSPTTSEVSQSSATNAMSEIDMDSTLVKKYDTRKTKARGRSSTILTSSVGVAGNNLTLGKKSLLGA